MIEEGRPLFVQIAESIEDSIVDGSLAEGAKAPSTNELSAFYRINPATAAKGINLLVDKQVLIKQRGVGMFVTDGARARLLTERREAFTKDYLDPLLAEATRLQLTPAELIAALQERMTDNAAPHTEGTLG
ncbi:MAG: GntR family transcriptional regulator [Tessaracoccus sp.]